VAYGWQQVALAENATEIRALAVQLYERLGTFTAHMTRMGKSLADSVKAYNQSVGSLEKMVLPGARRFTELGVKPRRELDTAAAIDETPREPSDSPGADETSENRNEAPGAPGTH
jgi:DNA recombination protein RmuC